MHFQSLVLASMATLAVAAPTGPFDGAYKSSPDMEEFYAKVSIHIDSFSGDLESCDLSKFTFPTTAKGLPAPTGTLKHVAIGRGTQNYTCADSTADTTPFQVGAVANLYDASCIAANFGDLLNLATDIALNISYPTDWVNTLFPPANIDLLGHHYFENTTTPTFNLNTTPQHQFGIALAHKNASINAPTGSVVGQFNQGFGATTWLYLTTIEGTVGGFTEVYRLNTAGGSAPATCAGQPAAFQIQYAAQYYFYV